MQPDIWRYQQQTTGIINLRYSDYLNIEIALPPLDEQRRIAKILDSADYLTMVLDRIIRKHQIIRYGIAYAAMHHELLPVSEWPMVSIDKILKGNPGSFIQTGPFGSQLHADEYTLDGVPAVMPQDIAKGYISTTSIARVPLKKAIELSRHRMTEGDAVLARRGDLSRLRHRH